MKAAWVKLGVCALTAAVMVGCAGAGGPSDEEMIQNIIADFESAMEAGDIDAAVMHYSDDFTDNQGQDKEAMMAFLQGAKDQGFLEDMDIRTEDVEIVIDGDMATVEPIEAEGAFGLLTLALELEKRDGTWVVTYQDQY